MIETAKRIPKNAAMKIDRLIQMKRRKTPTLRKMEANRKGDPHATCHDSFAACSFMLPMMRVRAYPVTRLAESSRPRRSDARAEVEENGAHPRSPRSLLLDEWCQGDTDASAGKSTPRDVANRHFHLYGAGVPLHLPGRAIRPPGVGADWRLARHFRLHGSCSGTGVQGRKRH